MTIAHVFDHGAYGYGQSPVSLANKHQNSWYLWMFATRKWNHPVGFDPSQMKNWAIVETLKGSIDMAADTRSEPCFTCFHIKLRS